MTDKEKMEHLAKLIQQSKDSLTQAEAFANEHSLSFRWDNDYGSRKQTFQGKGTKVYAYNHEAGGYGDVILDEGRWTSSSDGC